MRPRRRSGRGTTPALALVLCLLLTAPPVPAADPLPPFSALYKLTRNGLSIARSQVNLVAEPDGSYLYVTRTDPVGILAWLRGTEVHEHSAWDWHDGEIRPLEYVYYRVIRGRERIVRLTFDWDRGTVRNEAQGSVWSMDVPEGTLDRLLVQLAIMRDLPGGATELQYLVADGGVLKTYLFAVRPGGRVQTPLGSFETLRVERLHHEPTERSTTLWCAPALGYLPVQVEQREPDGGRFVMSIESLDGLPRRP
jgi:hypothetical protein